MTRRALELSGQAQTLPMRPQLAALARRYTSPVGRTHSGAIPDGLGDGEKSRLPRCDGESAPIPRSEVLPWFDGRGKIGIFFLDGQPPPADPRAAFGERSLRPADKN